MGKASKIDLIGTPWPANLLQFSRQTDAMRPGDELIITLADKDVQKSLIQFLHAIPDVSFHVSNTGRGFTIEIRKIERKLPAKQRSDS